MPIFDFICSKCRTSTECIQKVSDAAPYCPICKETMEKQLSKPGFVKVEATPLRWVKEKQ